MDNEVQEAEEPSDTEAESADQESPAEKTGKAAKALTKLVRHAIHEDLGPIPGSVSWANDRLWRVLKMEDPSGDPRKHATEEQIERAIARIVAEATTATGVSGALTGIGGLATSLVLLPANMASALVVNARMVGAIAHLRGYTVRDPLVETFAAMLVAGTAMKESLQVMGVTVGTKVTMNVVKNIPMSVIRAINKKVGFFLVAKYGTKRAAVTVAKAVPFVGAAVGGAVDAGFTKLVARRAKAFFEYTSVRHMPDAI